MIRDKIEEAVKNINEYHKAHPHFCRCHSLRGTKTLLEQALAELDKPKEPTDVSEFVKLSRKVVNTAKINNGVSVPYDDLSEATNRREEQEKIIKHFEIIEKGLWSTKELLEAQLKAKDKTIKAQAEETKGLKEAMNKVIEYNLQQAHDKYGDRKKAESWACVVTLREALKKALQSNEKGVE